MTKFLHLTLVALLALVCNVSVAQTTVTFTAGTDKGTQTNAGNAPDEVSKDGITIKTTTGNSAFGAAQYRFPKSSTTTFTSTVGNITKVEFTCTANGDAKYGPGCFTAPSTGSYTYEGKVGTWTGDASSFTLTASSNQVRATTIVFTISGGSTPTTKVTAPTISGETPFTETTTVTITADEGASIYYTTDGQDPDDRSGIEYTVPFTISETTTVKAIAYTADDQSTISEKKFVKGGQYTGDGTIANPYTTADAVAMNAAGALPADTAYYTGTISSINSIDTGSYGNATYDITTDGTTESLTVFRGYYLQAKKFTSQDQIKVGDKVIVKGKLIFYNNQSLEIGTRNYIYSLNGKTTDDTPVEPKDTVSYTVAQATAVLTAGTETSDVVYVTGKVSQIDELNTQYGNATYYISDDGTTTGQLQVFRGKYLNNEKFTADDQLKVGDEVKIAGVLQNYKKDETTTQEVTNSYIVTLNRDGGDTPEPADTASYTVAEATAVLTAGTQTEDPVYVTGIVSQISEVSAQYGNATYYLSDDGTEAGQLQVFRGKYLNNEKFTDASQLQLGDTVKVLGVLANYTKGETTTQEITNSYIVSLKSATKPAEDVTVDNIAAFKALDNNTNAVLTLKDAQVVYTWTSNNNHNSTYVRDASGAVLLYDAGLDLKANDVLNGTVNLQRSEYNNAVQARSNDKTSKDNFTVTDGAEAQPKTITVAQAADNVSDLVLISGVKVIAEQGSKSTRYYAVSGTDTLQIYDGFHLGYTFAEGENIAIKGILVQYRNSYEIYPVEDPAQTTGISDVKKVTVLDENAPIYNLAGQRVSKDYKGVVIQNGRKVIRK